jgi:hypothetical protein
MEFDTFEPSVSSAAPQRVNNPPTTNPRDSVALQRLMDEVRCEEVNGSSVRTAYDRAHNRHNR